MLFIGYLQEADTNSTSWIWYLLVVMLAVALIIWWMVQQSKKQSKEEKKEQEKQEVAKVSDSPKSERTEDDLTRIEGIGPKVATILKDAGIKSFDSLANADSAEVKSVLNEAGLQMMNPDGWIEQADLANKGDWEGLEQLQAELKGGRRK